MERRKRKTDNDWVEENKREEFRNELRRKFEFDALCPPPLVNKGSQIFAGLILGALVLVILAVLIRIALEVSGL